MEIRDTFFIDGRWTAPAEPGLIDVISPINEELVGRVARSTPKDIDAAVAAARRAFDAGPWPRLSVEERGSYLLRMAEILRPHLEDSIHLQIDEMGSPYSFMGPLTNAIVNRVGHIVDEAAAIDTREVRVATSGHVVVYRDPVGVAAAIIPWNAPVHFVLARLLPAALTGCTIVIKPSPETPLSGSIVADAAVEAGLPDGVFNLVPGDRDVGEHLVTHPGVDHVSFTGSAAAGIRVAALCGDRLRSATLELGGKSAAIILDDADLEGNLATLISSSMPNNGQLCSATTRILAPRERSQEVIDLLVTAVGAMKVGNPHDADTAFGPLVAERQRARVEGYIASGRADGATVVFGGGRPAGFDAGWYIEPTIFTNVDNGMSIAREEIFGPVVCIIEYDGDDEAIAIANDSEYGLGGAVFTADVERGLRVAERIQTGTCRINDAAFGGGGGPFGGVKNSGLGREYGREGFENYFELKSVTLPPSFDPRSSATLGARRKG